MWRPDAEIKHDNAGQLVHLSYCPSSCNTFAIDVPNVMAIHRFFHRPFLSVVMYSPVLNHLHQLKPGDLVADSLPFGNSTTSYEDEGLSPI
jgi:hypothetical protein